MKCGKTYENAVSRRLFAARQVLRTVIATRYGYYGKLHSRATFGSATGSC